MYRKKRQNTGFAGPGTGRGKCLERTSLWKDHAAKGKI